MQTFSGGKAGSIYETSAVYHPLREMFGISTVALLLPGHLDLFHLFDSPANKPHPHSCSTLTTPGLQECLIDRGDLIHKPKPDDHVSAVAYVNYHH